MMFGFMFIEMDSLDELKQTSGYGVVLQRDFKEEMFAIACNVVVEGILEEFTAQVCDCELKIVKRIRRKSLGDEVLAMKNKKKRRRKKEPKMNSQV